jgi:hypothetical protein
VEETGEGPGTLSDSHFPTPNILSAQCCEETTGQLKNRFENEQLIKDGCGWACTVTVNGLLEKLI